MREDERWQGMSEESQSSVWTTVGTDGVVLCGTLMCPNVDSRMMGAQIDTSSISARAQAMDERPVNTAI